MDQALNPDSELQMISKMPSSFEVVGTVSCYILRIFLNISSSSITCFIHWFAGGREDPYL